MGEWFDPDKEHLEAMNAEAKRLGLCQNCMHSVECDAQAVERGEHPCDSGRNGMGHDCPPNTSASFERYERLVLQPMRDRVAK